MTASLVSDIGVAALLLVTIGWLVTLDRRLARLRDAQGDMRQIVGEFDRAVSQAAASVESLKGAATAAENELSARIAKARELSEELEVLVASGNRVADRIAHGRAAPAAPAAPSPGRAAAPSQRSEAERELAELLRRAG